MGSVMGLKSARIQTVLFSAVDVQSESFQERFSTCSPRGFCKGTAIAQHPRMNDKHNSSFMFAIIMITQMMLTMLNQYRNIRDDFSNLGGGY